MSGGRNRDELTAALASRYWSEEEAEVVLRAQQASGLSEGEFSRRHGLGSRRLERWRRRLRESAQAPTMGRVGPLGVDFLPVRAISHALLADVGEAERGDERRAAGVMEVVLRGGRRVLVGAEVEPSAVARLAAALEGLTC